jgi:hypothetical protein
MQDATSKNKLYLSGESVEWFLIKDFEPIFQCSKIPLLGQPQARVSKVEQLLCILWYVSWRECNTPTFVTMIKQGLVMQK